MASISQIVMGIYDSRWRVSLKPRRNRKQKSTVLKMQFLIHHSLAKLF